MNSYGPGLAATMFSIKVQGSTAEIREQLNSDERLPKNEVRSCEEEIKALEHREHENNISDYTASGSIEDTRYLLPRQL
ncbi:hypothetical protein JCM11491_003772 [Sporobolomyces phaffii]